MSADTDLDHFEVYYNVGSAATSGSTLIDNAVVSTSTGISFDAGVAGLSNGDDVHFAVYSVDAAGNMQKSDINVTYDTTN